MIECPVCNTENESTSYFCINCGTVLNKDIDDPTPPTVVEDQVEPAPVPVPLPTVPAPQPVAPARPAAATVSPGRQLAIATGQAAIGILLVWFLRAVLLSFNFASGTVMPEFRITVEAIISFLAYLAIIAMLLSYASKLRYYWPLAFPQASSATAALTAIIYLFVLGMAYSALAPFLAGIIDNSGEVFRWLNVLITLVAIGLLAWAVKVIYDALPAWLNGLRLSSTGDPQGTVACLNCGHLNAVENQFCGNCGSQLEKSR